SAQPLPEGVPMSRLRWAALALVLVPVTARTDGPEKKEAAPEPKVEFRFADGSSVQGVLLEESIEVQTKYGKLSVPVAEVRRIDSASGLPGGTERRMEAGIKRLGADDFKWREGAVRELVALKAQAVPAWREAARSGDAEVSRRAKDALQQIEAKVPAELLVFP